MSGQTGSCIAKHEAGFSTQLGRSFPSKNGSVDNALKRISRRSPLSQEARTSSRLQYQYRFIPSKRHINCPSVLPLPLESRFPTAPGRSGSGAGYNRPGPMAPRLRPFTTSIRSQTRPRRLHMTPPAEEDHRRQLENQYKTHARNAPGNSGYTT